MVMARDLGLNLKKKTQHNYAINSYPAESIKLWNLAKMSLKSDPIEKIYGWMIS